MEFDKNRLMNNINTLIKERGMKNRKFGNGNRY